MLCPIISTIRAVSVFSTPACPWGVQRVPLQFELHFCPDPANPPISPPSSPLIASTGTSFKGQTDGNPWVIEYPRRAWFFRFQIWHYCTLELRDPPFKGSNLLRESVHLSHVATRYESSNLRRNQGTLDLLRLKCCYPDTKESLGCGGPCCAANSSTTRETSVFCLLKFDHQ